MIWSQLTARIPATLTTRGAAIAAVATLQLGALGYMVADRVRLVTTGREIVLPIIPVDPRDLFKGDYVRLGFPISNVPRELTKDLPAGTRNAFVTLEQQADSSWKVLGTSLLYPSAVASNQVVLRARPTSVDNSHMRYGIERYYVPEGKGPALEKLAREKKLAAVVAVDKRGNAAIKGLSTDGKRVYDEPLF
jgi:uncharacterized membrane-anchored protein